MNNLFSKIFLSFFFLVFFTSAFSQEAEWKHYEYPDINLQFDLPADFEFEYPDDGTLSFVGKNSWVTFMFRRIEKAIISEEQRKEELYLQAGMTDDHSGDPNFMSGTTANGYFMAGTTVQIEELDEPAVAMLLSDPGNNQLNFLIVTTYGGEEATDSPAYKQAGIILQKFGPIKK
jgi:hypothetical protein